MDGFTVEAKIEELVNKAKAKAESTYHFCMVEMMKCSSSIRKMKWEDTYDMFQARSAPKQEQESKVKDEIQKIKDQIALDVQSAIKENKSARKRAPPSTGVRKSTRKRTTRNAFTPGGLQDETVLTSTANTTRTRGRRLLQTPCNISIVAPPSALPMITPKIGGIEPFTPQTGAKSALRIPKPNETTFSINGSPIYTGATTLKRGKGRKAFVPAATVGLGDGRELILEKLDDADAPDIQLDEDAIAKVLAVKKQLDKLLKYRNH